MAGTSTVTEPTARIADPTQKPLSSVGTGQIGRDQFLQLLVSQLEHQDPLNPMQGTEFTAQLAQFSSLEQLINMNESLKALGSLQTSLTQSRAVGMLGKQIIADGNIISVGGGAASDIIFSLDQPSSQTAISVFNAQGELVSILGMGSLPAGRHSRSFSATNSGGDTLPDGIYTFRVLATDVDGNEVPAGTFSTGIVSGIAINGDGTVLKVGDKDISIADVVEIAEPKEPTPTE